jgi:hypothetical protein
MMNPFREVNWNPGLQERRKFAVSLLVGFPGVAAVLLVAGRWQGSGWNFVLPLAVAGIGVGLGLILWVVPQIARPFYVGWHAFACSAGFVMGNLVLAGVYLLLFAPVGLARRAMGRRTFHKGFDKSAPSYWNEEPPPGDPARYYRQF